MSTLKSMLKRRTYGISILICALISVSGWNHVAQAEDMSNTSSDAKKQAVKPADEGEVQDRAVPRPGGASTLPGRLSVSNLTEKECKTLGCNVIVDHKCPISNVGVERLRCVCSTGSACIDKAN